MLRSPLLPKGEKPEENIPEGAKAIENIRHLINEQGERIDASLIGKPVFGKPVPQTASSSDQSSNQQSGAYSDLFMQLISTGYRPSNAALQDAGRIAYSGPVHMARTWLAALFIRLLRIRSSVGEI